jgi:hypothetical protein
MIHLKKLTLPISIAAILAGATVFVASCTQGTNYDGSYTGGYTVGDGGATTFTIPAGTSAPTIVRTTDGSFGVYFSNGSFPAGATVTIGTPTNGAGGSTYPVSITGGTSTKSYVVFYGNGNQAEVTDNGIPLGVQVQANGIFFGLVSKATMTGLFARGNQNPTGMGNGTGMGNQTLAPCLQQCQLGSNNGGTGTTLDYCYANSTTGNSGDSEKLFDCVIACGEPDSLASMCKSSSTGTQSVACAGISPAGSCGPPNSNCCQPQGPTGGPNGCSSTCPAGDYQFSCDGPEDCNGAKCCVDASGTHCGGCDLNHEVCHNGGSSNDCGTNNACTPVTVCMQAPPFQLSTCGPLLTCPFLSSSAQRSVKCGMDGLCTGSEVCGIPKPSKGGAPMCFPATCNTNDYYCFECLGDIDCPSTAAACCAYPGGSHCVSSQCAPENQLCSNGPPTLCATGSCPGGQMVCNISQDAGLPPNIPQLSFCNPPSMCPVNP